MNVLKTRFRRLLTLWRDFSRDRIAVVSLIVLLLIIGVLLAAPWLPVPGPTEFSDEQYAAPSSAHWMGTDHFGRSVLSRTIWGGRLALLIGFVSAGISMALGTILGALSGYYGGWIDDVFSRTFDIFLLIPSFFLAIVMVALFGPNVYFIIAIIGITMWPRSARIMRAQVLSLKNRQFIHAVRVSGASHRQTLFSHVVPNGLAPVITHGTILMGVAILIEAALSFLGLGDPTTISWGRMIFSGQEHLRVAPWMSIFPGVSMLVLVSVLNLVGDGLNHALNPHTREKTAGFIPDQPSLQKIVHRSDGIHPGYTPKLMEARELCMYYALDGSWVRAVDGVSLTLGQGETLGLVGESGCGKTSVGFTLLRTLPKNAHILGGNVFLSENEILNSSNKEFQQFRWKKISMIFQSSMNSLNPVKRVGDQLVAAYLLHRPAAKEETAKRRVNELFDIVGIPTDRIDAFPHELSGGMRQRVIIALALLLEPEVIIADEPTTALDVLVQDQIMAELERLRNQMNLSMILITHDMGLVAESCDRIAVMYAGQIVEVASSSALFSGSRHPYTRGLLGSLPTLTGQRQELISIPGESMPSVGESTGCRFAPRCPLATDLCRKEDPPFLMIDANHFSRCHYAKEEIVENTWDDRVISHS